MFFLSLLPFFISNQLSRRNLSIESTRHFRRNLPEIEEKWFSSSGIGGNNRTWSGFTCLSFDNLSQSLSLPPPDRVLFEYIIELCSPIEHTYEHPSILAKNEVDNELCTSLSVRAVLYTHFQTQLFRPIRSMKPYRTIFCNINLFAEKIENDNDADLYISFRIHFSLLLLEEANLANFNSRPESSSTAFKASSIIVDATCSWYLCAVERIRRARSFARYQEGVITRSRSGCYLFSRVRLYHLSSFSSSTLLYSQSKHDETGRTRFARLDKATRRLVASWPSRNRPNPVY